MALIIIGGMTGSGKTALATKMGLDSGRHIWSNYKIDSPMYHHLTPARLLKVEPPSVVITDEVWSWIDARCSGKASNRYLSYPLFQSRKRGFDWIITTQEFDVIDKRFREFPQLGGENMVILAEVHKDVGARTEDNPEGILGFIYYSLGPYRPGVFYMSWDTARPYLARYDTNYEIAPPMENLEYTLSLGDPDDLQERLTTLTDEITAIAPPSKWTLAMLKAYCLEQNIPHRYVDMLYGRIKLAEINGPKKGKGFKAGLPLDGGYKASPAVKTRTSSRQTTVSKRLDRRSCTPGNR